MHPPPTPALPADRSSLGPVGPDGLPRRFGKYTLLRKLAAGGMAELFLALHRSVAGFEKLVVIKRILPSMNNDQAFIDMLLHEARVAASLSHPNIVQTFDVGQVDGTYFIAMEHIHGEDVRSIVRQMRKRDVADLPLEHAIGVMIGTCAGLAYAHERRDLDGRPLDIVHRDISPQNLVVTFSGDVKIVDFGIAKSGVKVEDTKSGQLKGKVPYMSPEQAAGEAVDHRSDIFAVGVMLFELTTGKRLFKGGSEFETLKLILEREYPRPSTLRPGYPAALEAIVMRALAKRREDRYQSASEMQADLEAFARAERIPVSAVSLGKWMQWVFADKLAAQREALQDVKALADVIAAQQREDGPDPEMPASLPSSPSSSSSSSVIAGPHTVTGPPPPRTASPWPMLAGGVALVLVGAFVWATRSPAAATSQAPQSTVTERRGTLRITSEPPGAAIVIDGDPRAEVTPATIERLPLGKPIAVRVTRDGFEPHRSEVTLSEAAPDGTVTASLAAQAPQAAASAAPSKVEAPAPVAAAQAPKSTAAATEKVAAAAPAGNGKLNVAARGGYCNVSVDGTAHGPTPVAGVVLGAGTHRVTCKPESGPALSQTVRIDADQTARIAFTIP